MEKNKYWIVSIIFNLLAIMMGFVALFFAFNIYKFRGLCGYILSLMWLFMYISQVFDTKDEEQETKKYRDLYIDKIFECALLKVFMGEKIIMGDKNDDSKRQPKDKSDK